MGETQPPDTRVAAPRLALHAQKRTSGNLSEEALQQLADARAKAAEKREEVKATKREIRDHALETLWPLAYKVMQMALEGAVDKGVADRDAINAAFRVHELKFGKATQVQKIESDVVQKIEYVAAPFNFLSSDN